MEEENLPFQTPFFLQTANNTNPKQQKQPKPQTSKCNCNPSSSITQKKFRALIGELFVYNAKTTT
jgi:hypothetical protein